MIMKVQRFNDNEIKEIFNLYVYGFSKLEILAIFYGQNVDLIIETKIKSVIQEAQEYKKNIGIEFENIDISKELLLKEKIIECLKSLKQEIDRNISETNKDWLKSDIDIIINIIYNLEQIKEDIKKNIRIQNDEHKDNKLKDEISNIDSILRNSVSTDISDKIKTKIEQIRHEPIITEEEWERIQNKLKNDLK